MFGQQNYWEYNDTSTCLTMDGEIKRYCTAKLKSICQTKDRLCHSLKEQEEKEEVNGTITKL